MARNLDLLTTAIAPAIWGSTYIVTTHLLPHGYPLHVAMLRALPAGLLLLLIVRQLPQGIWWLKVLVLGALNFSIFWWLLFVTAYRLPGGVAAPVTSIQTLMVIALARLWLGTPIRPLAIVAAVAGIFGVALIVLTPKAALDPIGVVAGFAAALSMAAGTVLSRRWQPPVSPLTFSAWQLTAGGVLLLPAVLTFEPALPPLTGANLAGFLYLGLIGSALTYILWFRGLARLAPSVVSTLGLLSPVMAVLLGWLIAGETLTPIQGFGIAVVLVSVWLSQRAQQAPLAPARAAAQPSAEASGASGAPAR